MTCCILNWRLLNGVTRNARAEDADPMTQHQREARIAVRSKFAQLMGLTATESSEDDLERDE